MRWSDIPWSPESRTLRQFAALWIMFFSGLALWQGFAASNASWAVGFGMLAVTVGPIGLAWPRAIRPLFVSWMILAWPVGWMVSHVLLAIVFYGLITPIGLVFRLAGRDTLCRSFRPEQASYWIAKPSTKDVRGYFRQF